MQDVTLADGRHGSGSTSPGSCDAWGGDLVGERGLSAVGAVVGATFPREVAEARELLPRSVLLLPGHRRAGRRSGRRRSGVRGRPGERARLRVALGDLRVPRRGGDYRAAAGAEAERLAREVWAVSGA